MKIVENFFKRYEKQILLPEIGLNGQKKIMKARVLYIGSGGLATTALPYLAAAGVGTLGIVDFDYIDISNLQRQTIYTTYQLAQSKTLCAKKYLEKLNPNVHYKTFNTKLTEKNIENIMKNFDIVIDGTDNIKSKILINKTTAKQHKPMIYGAAAGYTGQITTFYSVNGPCYSCLYPKNTLSKWENDSCNLGVLGPLPGLIGCLQATECLNLILTKKKQKFNLSKTTLVGSLLTIDLKKYDIRTHKINKRNTCAICVTQQKEKVQQKNVKKKCHSIDKRTYQKIKHFAYTINLNKRRNKTKHARILFLNYTNTLLQQQTHEKLNHIPKKTVLIITCKYGFRSKNIATYLRNKLKFLNVFYVNRATEN